MGQLSLNIGEKLNPLRLSPENVILRREFPQLVTVQWIVKIICRHFNLPENFVFVASHPTRFLRNIQRFIIFFVWGMTNYSYSKVARVLGIHTLDTVILAIEQAETLLQNSSAFRNTFEQLQTEIFTSIKAEKRSI